MSVRVFRRKAFTVVELLVAMTIMVVLASLTLLVVVNMGERDGTTDAAGLTRQWLMIAKNRASRDHAPRGLRLVVGMDPNNPAKTSPYWVTECQYIEAPPILVTYPAQNGNFAPTGSLSDPRVEFIYALSQGTTAQPTHPNPPNSVLPAPIGKICEIVNLRQSEAFEVLPNSILQLPVIGSWHRITNVVSRVESPVNFWRVRVNLDTFPDAQMGAAGTIQPVPGTALPCYTTQLFGITSPPRPLVAEPPLQLPKEICIDLTPFTPLNGANPPFLDPPSLPSHMPAMVDYDILFAPNGNALPVGAGAFADGTIFLWHRDYTKLRNQAQNAALIVTNAAPRTYEMYPFQQGGEQQIVAIRCKTGALGQFPVLWPSAGGVYAAGDTPWTLARFGATAP